MQKQKGFILPIVIAVIAIAILGGAGYFVYQNYSAPKPIACTLEAKICPDGSSVGRTGPNCEFAECPEFSDQTAGWQTYSNNDIGYEIQYPEPYAIKTANCYAWKKDKNLNDSQLNDAKSIVIGQTNYNPVHICYFEGQVEDFLRGSGSQSLFSKIKINDVTFYKYEFEMPHDTFRAWHYAQIDPSHVIFIDENATNAEKNTFNSIISTFKFTK
ncbi:MAG: hypothetical protein Q8Q48_01810 [Candidatus Staskawiczbacteria bacterium]|nr:hypothetical protein [Candidatus Staskawiczbacteria bacterium]